MNEKSKRELEGIKTDLKAIIRELNEIADGVGAEFMGIGNEYCTSGIRKVAEQCKSVRRRIDSID